MRKFDMYWCSDPDWYDFKEGIPILKKDAPKQAQESYNNYLKEKQLIDKVTARTLIIPKNDTGIEYYEKNDAEWNRGSYETDNLLVFAIPYEEFCLLRAKTNFLSLFEENNWRVDTVYLERIIEDISQISKDVSLTLEVLKTSLAYKTFVEFVEECR